MNSTSTDARKRCEKCLDYVKVYLICFKCDAAYHIYCWKKVPGAYVNQRGLLFCCSGLTSNYVTMDSSEDQNLVTQGNPPEGVIETRNVDGYNEDFENSLIMEEDSEWNEFKYDTCLLEVTNKEYLGNYYSECHNKEGESVLELKEDKDLENCLIKEEDYEWNESKCDVCLLEFANKEHLEDHYNECPYKEGEFIQDLKKDKDLENHLPKEENSEPKEEYLENHCGEYLNKQGGSIPLHEDKAGLVCSFHNEENFQNDYYEQHMKLCDVESSYSQLKKDNDIYATDTKSNLAPDDDKEKNCKCTISNCSGHVKECVARHMCIHNSEGSFKCNMCDYATKESETLKSHILSEHCDGDKNFESRLCKFSTPPKDDRHPHINNNARLFKCDWCDYAGTQKSNLTTHIKRKHSNAEKGYKCADCKYSTYVKASLIGHMRTHTKEKPFKCDMCDYAATVKTALKMHILVKHSNVEKTYKCEDCKFSTYKKDLLVGHKRVHTKERPFKCNTCEYAATHKPNLNYHILTKHSEEEKQYKCENCEYSSFRKVDLLNHMQNHTNERQFKCDMCEYAAVQKICLKNHVLRKHSNAEKQYKCGVCEYSTHIKQSLVNHKRIHTNERPYRCDMCNYAAVDKSRLNLHILRKHSNFENKYKCTDCKYSTYAKAHLVAHKRIHTKERPFKCEMCDYAATVKGNLKVHTLLKHSNVNKQRREMFKCGACEYCTYLKANLVSHVRTHTNERPFKCSMCDYVAAQRIHLNIHISSRHFKLKKAINK